MLLSSILKCSHFNTDLIQTQTAKGYVAIDLNTNHQYKLYYNFLWHKCRFFFYLLKQARKQVCGPLKDTCKA